MEKKIRLLVADDHDLFRSGIIGLLRNNENFIVAGEAKDGEDFVNKYFELKPDISLIDIFMPGLNGIEAFSKIRKTDGAAKGLFFSAYFNERHVDQVVEAGGSGLVSKRATATELVHAINEVEAGRQYFGNDFIISEIHRLIRQFEMKIDAEIAAVV